MDPITIVLAVAGIGIGFGASTTIYKRSSGALGRAAEKELKKLVKS